MPGIGHKLPLPLHVFRNGTDGPAGERNNQRKHQKPADRAKQQRQKCNTHDRISAGAAVQEDNAVSAFRARENLISIGSGRSARPAHIKAEGKTGGFLFRDGSNMAYVRADYMTLTIQVRNKIQCGHAHVIVHRLIQKTVPPSAVQSFRFTASGRGLGGQSGFRFPGSRGRRKSLTVRAREKDSLPPQIVQEEFRLTDVGNGVEHVQRTQNNQKQNGHGDHCRNDKFFLQCPDHFGTSSV